MSVGRGNFDFEHVKRKTERFQKQADIDRARRESGNPSLLQRLVDLFKRGSTSR